MGYLNSACGQCDIGDQRADSWFAPALVVSDVDNDLGWYTGINHSQYAGLLYDLF